MKLEGTCFTVEARFDSSIGFWDMLLVAIDSITLLPLAIEYNMHTLLLVTMVVTMWFNFSVTRSMVEFGGKKFEKFLKLRVK